MVHGRGGFWLKFNAERGDYRAEVTRDDWFILQVSGPESIKVLRKLDPSDRLLAAKYMHVVPINVAGHEIHALRQGMSGELGFELQGPVEWKADVYAAILEAGEEFGIRRMGGRVAPINHLEAGYPTIATDYIPAILRTRSTSITSWRPCRHSPFRHTSPAAIAAAPSRSTTEAR